MTIEEEIHQMGHAELSLLFNACQAILGSLDGYLWLPGHVKEDAYILIKITMERLCNVQE